MELVKGRSEANGGPVVARGCTCDYGPQNASLTLAAAKTCTVVQATMRDGEEARKLRATQRTPIGREVGFGTMAVSAKPGGLLLRAVKKKMSRWFCLRDDASFTPGKDGDDMYVDPRPRTRKAKLRALGFATSGQHDSAKQK